jgi:ribosomal protein S18 acetylase RimI-like enzyme
VDLCFQNFEAELVALPGDYAAPAGTLLLAYVDEALAGCGAMRPLSDVDYANACEMKRLYVRPAYRGQGLGRALSLRLIEEATRLGYRRMRLDALASMTEARGLYRSLGFREIPPYYHNPLPGPLFFERDLTR